MSVQSGDLSPSSSSDNSYHSPPDGYPHRFLEELEEGKPSVFVQENRNSSIPMDFEASDNQSNRRFSISGHPDGHSENMGDQFRLFGERDINTSSLIPQSAPANTKSFPIPMRVSQDHIRTRSVQGEPPSATLFSPSSPLSQPSWVPTEAPEHQPRSIGGPPTYNPHDATTWARRGFAALSDHTHHPIRGPSSVPNDFAPIGTISQHRFPDTLPIGPQSFSAALSDDSPSTVSPGVYQSGFSMPTYRPAYHPPSPRHEGRPSISASPYDPRSRPRPPATITASSSARGVNTRPGDRAGLSRHEDESGLPSASLKGFHHHPFEGVMREENAGMNVDHH